MNKSISIERLLKASAISAAAAMMVACASSPVVAPGASEARQELTDLQSNPKLAPLAPVAIRDAETAVKAAEEPREDEAEAEHLAYLAKSKVEYATAKAEEAYYQSQRDNLAKEREQIRLDVRSAEAQQAQHKAEMAQEEAEQLRQELAELNAKKTDRGMVMTLGDVLFETGKAELKPGATANLTKLADYMKEDPEAKVQIEGHTDSTGSDSFNKELSQERADAVMTYLTAQGITSDRMSAMGMGEDYPIAPNDNAAGRQQNRRVEIIIDGAVS